MTTSSRQSRPQRRGRSGYGHLDHPYGLRFEGDIKETYGPRPESPTKAKNAPSTLVCPFCPENAWGDRPFSQVRFHLFLAGRFSNINEQIRAAMKNELKLRVPMRSKIFREPINDTKPKKHLDPDSPLGQAMGKIRMNPLLTNMEKPLLTSKLLPNTP